MRDEPPRGVFISRQRELSLLCRALEEAQGRRDQIALVSGEAGIGKTRLAQELAAIAASGVVSVLWGRCVQGEASPPCWPWTQIVRSFAGEQKLAAHAFEDALPHFERAWRARNAVPLDAEAGAILFGLGSAQATTALRWNRQEGWANLRKASGYYLQAGDVGRAVAAATHPSIVPEGAADVSEVVEPILGEVPRGSREEGWLRARLGAAAYFETGDYQRARAAFDRALEIAATHCEPALELRTLAYETSVDHFDLRWPDVLSKSRRVLKLARRIDDLHSETYARYRTAFVLTHTGCAGQARLEVEASLAAAERLRDHGFLADALYVAALLAQLTGAWTEAREHSNRGLTLAPQHLPLLHGRVLLEFETGHEQQGRDYLQRLVEVDRRAGTYPLAGVFTAITLSQTRRGRARWPGLKLRSQPYATCSREPHRSPTPS